jgi:tetratricopeptide (TPR) repeat protein
MNAIDADLLGWRKVERDLRLILAGSSELREDGDAAALYYRLAVVRLQCALLEDFPTIQHRIEDERSAHDALDGLGQELGGAQDPSILKAIDQERREEAVATLRAGLRLDEGHTPSLRAYAALASIEGRWKAVTAALERLALRGEGESASRIYERLGDVHWRHLDAPTDARTYYLKAMRTRPNDVKLMDQLLKLDLELERWESAIDLCESLIARMDRRRGRPEMTVTYMLTMGEIHVYGQHRPDVALAYYLSAMNALPSYQLSYTLLRELLEAHGWSELEPEFGALPERLIDTVAGPLERLRGFVESGQMTSGDIVEALRAKMTTMA